MFPFRDLLKGTGVYSAALLARRAVGLLMLPVYTRLLTPADYGILELLDLTVSLISILLGMRIGQALFYFQARAGSQEERERQVSTALICSLGIGVVVAVAGIAGAAPLAHLALGGTQYAAYMRLALGSFCASLTMETGLCCLRASNDLGAYLRLSLVQVASEVALNLILIGGLGMGVAGFLWRTLIVQSAVAVWLLWRLLRPIGVRLDWRLLGSMLRYSVPLGASGMAMFLIHFGDRFFLRHYVSLAELGIYALAYKMGMLISYVQMPFDLYWSSRMFAIVGAPGGDRVNVRVTTYMTAVLAFVAIALAAWAQPIVRLMAGPAFAEGAELVPWLALVYVIRTVSEQLRTAFLLEKKTGQDAVVTWCGGAACLAAYAVLIPWLHVWGAVLATGLGFGVMFVVGLRRAQAVRYFAYDFGRLGAAGAVLAAVVAVVSFSHPATLGLQLLQGAGLVLGSLALLLLPGALQENEKLFLGRLWRGIVWRAVRQGIVWRDQARGRREKEARRAAEAAPAAAPGAWAPSGGAAAGLRSGAGLADGGAPGSRAGVIPLASRRAPGVTGAAGLPHRRRAASRS